MPATTCFHDSVPYPVLQKTDFVLHDPVSFSPTNGVFNPDAEGGNPTLRCVLRGWKCSARRFSLGLDDRDVLQAEALETRILIQTAARWQALPSPLGQALLRGVAFRCVSQEAHLPGRVDHQDVVARVTLLLTTVIFVLLFGSGRAMERPCSAIMPTRGVGEPPSVAGVSTSAATSAAVRAGSRS